jgi:hypothetical protein
VTFEELLARLAQIAKQYRDGLLTEKDLEVCHLLVISEYQSS